MSATSIGFDIFARDRASKTLDKVGNSAESSGHKFRLLGAGAKMAALGLAAGLGAAGVAAYKMAQGAMEDQQAAGILAKQMQNSAGATKGQISATEDWISAQGVAFGVADDDLRPALGRLVAVTHDVGKAQKLASLGMNISAGTGKSLSAVTTALAKAQTGSLGGLSRLGVATKDASGHTLTLQQITEKLSKTYSGQAAKAADTTAGKFARLKLAMSESGEAIGYHLLPPLTAMAGWLVSTGIPAMGKFSTAIGRTFGPPLRAAGQVIATQIVPALARFGQALVPIVQAIGARLVPVFHTMANTAQNVILPAVTKLITFFATRVGPVFAQVVQIITGRVLPIFSMLAQFIYGKLLPAVVAIASKVATNLKPVFDQLVATFRAKVLPALDVVLKKFHEWQPTIQKVVLIVVKVVGVVLTFAAAILGKVLPVLIRFSGFLIGGVIAVIGRLVGQLITGTKQIISFGRAVVGAVQAFVRFQQGVQQKVAAVLTYIGQLPAKINSAIGNLSHLLWSAGTAIIDGLIQGVESKIGELTSKLHSITKLIPMHKGPIEKDRKLLTPAGAAIMAGLIAGIRSGEAPLKTVLDKVTGYVQSTGDKLKGLLAARKDFAAGFQGFASSIFGSDSGSDSAPTMDSILTYASSQRDQSAQVKADVAKLTKMHLSKALIQQMQAAGASGIAQMHTLAGGSSQQIALLNSLNAQTSSNYGAAGNNAAGAMFNGQISQAQHDHHLAEEIANALHKVIRNDKGDIHIHLEGHTIVESIRKHQRNQGKKATV